MDIERLEEAVSEALPCVKLSGWEAAVGQDENFMSDVKRVTATFTGRSGLRETTSLVVKSAGREGPSGDQTVGLDVEKGPIFEREILVYNILKRIEGYINGKGEDLILWARCFGSTKDPYQIAMEDLKLLGYEMRDKLVGLDENHAELAVQALGAFHALSWLVPDISTKFNDHSTYIVSASICKLSTLHGMKVLADVIYENWGPEWNHIGKWFEEKSVNMNDTFGKLFKLTKGRYDVLNHGDCWNNNIMFHYKDGLPTSARFIDFQFCFMNSLAWDLTYLLYLSVNREVRLAKMDSLINVYQKSFSDTLRRVDCQKRAPTIPEINDLMTALLPYAAISTCIFQMEIGEYSVDYSLYTKDGMKDFFKKEWFIFHEKGIKNDLKYFENLGLFSNKCFDC